MDHEKWDKRYWELAKYITDWSKDPDAQVAAVLVNERGSAVALGYNGLPIGVEDSAERLKDKKLKLDMIVHAEQNALLIAGRAAAGSTIYVYGKPVCSRCAGLLIQAGVQRVVSEDPEADPTSKWLEPGKLAVKMLWEAKVKVDFRAREVLQPV